MWKEISQGQKMMLNIKNKEGGVETDRKKIVSVATEFYKQLYGRDKMDGQGREEALAEDHEGEEVPSVLVWEVEDELKKLKVGKAPGPDNIDNKILKDFREILAKLLEELFNLILEKEEIPKQWEVAEIMLIYKKGKRNNIENYRPISLTSNVCKIFMKIMKNRLYNQLDLQQPEEQAGFRRNYETIDHIHTINQVIEKAKEYKLDLYMMFVDYKKAFDLVKHKKIWESLSNQGVPRKLVRIIKNVYKEAKAYLKMEGKKGPIFRIWNGVKQGDPMSSSIFNSVLEEVFRKLDWERKGVNIGGCFLSNLRFADDIVLMSTRKEELREMATDLIRESKKGGLEWNMKKTKIMKIRQEDEIGEGGGLEIEGELIEEVSEYVYLGQTVSAKEGQEREIKVRRNKAWGKFWSLQKVFRGGLSNKGKLKILESCVMPVLTYGAETWATTKKHVNDIQKTQREMVRIILGVKRKERVSNEELRRRANVIDIGFSIKIKKFKYAGHVVRGKVQRWARKAMEWIPYNGRRGRGRPRVRWEDEIKNRVGVAWERMVWNRAIWRKIGEAYAQEWVAC